MIYLDASVVVAALANEPSSPSIRAWLDQQADGDICASGWTAVETASALSVKCRIGALSAQQLHQALRSLDVLLDMNWAIIGVAMDDFAEARFWTGQSQLGLRGGDALHLMIARRNDLILATLDKKLTQIAAQLSVPCAEVPVA